MQVISRQKGESLVIGDDIIITVVEIRGDKVRLGVEAPKEIPTGNRENFAGVLRADSVSQ
ncbi:MAG: carbon storage regulator [Planctomycetaceae bacterium]|nr:carbon storage regulator [Planctomycetaceae bacterium]